MTALLSFLSDWRALAGIATTFLLGGGAALFFIPGFKEFFLGTKIGRYLVLAGMILLGVMAALTRVRMLGRRDEQEKQARQTVENESIRKGIENENAAKSDADLEHDLGKWVRDK